MVVLGIIIVLLASLIDDWCVAYAHLNDPLQAPIAYTLHGQTIWLASLALFALGCVVLWTGHAGAWLLGGAGAWFLVFSSWLNFPVLERMKLLPRGWVVPGWLQQLVRLQIMRERRRPGRQVTEYNHAPRGDRPPDPPDDRPPNLREVVAMACAEVLASAVEGVRRLIQQGDFPEVLGPKRDSFSTTPPFQALTSTNSPDRAARLRQLVRADFNTAAWNLALEWIALSLHLIERIPGSALDTQNRSQFMAELVNEVSATLSRAILADQSDLARRNFENHFLSICTERSEVYGPLPVAMGSGTTLFSEAARNITETYFPSSPRRQLAAHLLASYGFPLLYTLAGALRPALRAVERKASPPSSEKPPQSSMEPAPGIESIPLLLGVPPPSSEKPTQSTTEHKIEIERKPPSMEHPIKIGPKPPPIRTRIVPAPSSQEPAQSSSVLNCRCGHLKKYHFKAGRCFSVRATPSGPVACSCTGFQPV